MLSIDTRGLTPAQRETALILVTEAELSPSVTEVQIWAEAGEHGEVSPIEMGVSIVDDGATMVGFFGESGNLVGHWM